MAQITVVASSLSSPTGIAFNQVGEMFVTNWSANSVVKIGMDGMQETIYSDISSPAGIVIDAQENLYVASYEGNYLLKIDANGASTQIAVGFHTPTGIAFAENGELLVTNRASGEIIALDLNSGQKRVVATGLNLPVGVTQLPDRSLVVSQYSGRLTRVHPSGEHQQLGSDFIRPGVGIVTESSHTVVLIDNGVGVVRRINVETGKTELLAEGFSGAVALAYFNNQYYVGTWSDGRVQTFKP